MPWDDELEQLILRVKVVHGVAAVERAITRAMEQALRQPGRSHADFNLEEYYPLLKSELRKLTTMH